MTAYTIPTPITWPTAYPKPQVLLQSVTKTPTTLESDAGTPTNSQVVNNLASSYVQMVFFCTMCEMQQIVAFYTNELSGGLKPFAIQLRTEEGFAVKTVRATLSGLKMVSEQHAEVTMIAEIEHEVIT